MGARGVVLVFCALYAFKMTSAVLQARFCVTSKAEMEKCNDMRSAFDGANLKQIGCVQGQNRYDCMSLIKSGKAELMRADDTDIYAAGKFYGLIPILSESSSTDVSAPSYLYKAVVVIRKDSPIKSVDLLYKQKSCHTGVGRTVGWTVPVSNLIAMKTMSVVDCDNPVATVGAFFSQSCAPEAFTQANDIDNINPTNVCSLCEDRRCPSTDKYAGYSGAIQCLLDGRGTVAFAKHTTIDELAQGDATIQKDDFRLLCRDGTVKGINEWNQCSWATRPTDAIMTSGALPTDTVGALRDLIEKGSRKFNVDTAGFNMFSSSNYDGTNLMFTDGTKRLSHVTTSDYRSYLGEGYLNTMTNYINCPVTDRWCVISDVEEDKCTQMAAAFAAARITNKMACVRAQTHVECMEKIKDGDADLVTLDGGDVYQAGKKYGLVPILAENYGDMSATSYFAVAVVRKSNSGVTFNNLKGKTSCHTGIEKTSGWNMPIGTLLEKKYIPESKRKCDVIKSVGKFFSKSCVPGALDSKYNPTGSNPENLCDLCGGRASCQRDSSNKYYDYAGALRCLVEKNADVAFVKHSTVPDNTDSNAPSWAANLRASDFELLCPDGSRKAVTDWLNCNLGQVRSHTLVTSGSKPLRDRHHYVAILKKGELIFGKDSTVFKMFSTHGGRNALFDDKTTSLTEIAENMQVYDRWLGATYIRAIQAVSKQDCTSSGTKIMYHVTYIWCAVFIATSAVKKMF